MKIKKRELNRSDWINNFFIFQDDIYFTQENYSEEQLHCLFKIKKEILINSYKDKLLANSNFLANPLIDINMASISSNIEILKRYDNYIQNYIELNNKIYISFIIENKVVTYNIEDLNTSYNLQIIVSLEDKLLIVKDNKNYITDNNLEIIKEIDLEKIIINLIKTNHGYVIHTNDEKIGLYDQNFKLVKWIDESNEYKKIFLLNKNNILISYFEQDITYIKNVITDIQDVFINDAILRGVLLNKNLFLAKIKYNNICFLY